MKRFFSLIAIALAVIVSSCNSFDDTDIWNKLNDHEERISDLEELCKQMNTNISALQAVVNALQKNDYITNVAPVRKDGEDIGYTITFAYGDTITIYHGQNGKDGVNGENGKDGYTPKIGVMKDTDGIYYWTVDGEWLLDGKGNKIQANGVNGTDGTNGTDGQDGTDGEDGTDGVTPRLKIENDYWYVSYDEGATWIELGKATGEDGKDGNDGTDGSDGADGEDGDSIFKSVTQDDEYVYFNLSDGTMITLPKHDKENIQFEDLQVKAICCKNWDTNNDGELSYAEAAAVTDIGTVFNNNTNIIAFTELKYFTGLSKIADNAFNGCIYLWKITIPTNITTIGKSAFESCSRLSSVSLPQVVKHIESNAFYKCKLSRINALDIKVWCNIEFGNETANPLHCGAELYLDNLIVTELKFPINITKIQDYAFYGYNKLSSVTIDDNILSIGAKAFYDCSGSLNINNKIVEDNYTAGTSIIENETHPLFGSKFTSITIGEEVQVIGSYAFYKYQTLQKLIIQSQSTSIGDYAFYACNALITVDVIENSTNSKTSVIGEYAFFGCTVLQNAPIHNNIVEIGEDAFWNCTSLISVIIPKSVEKIGECAFYGCTGELELNCANISQDAFKFSDFSKIVINDNVNIIDKSAFEGNDSITEIVIPDSVTRIEYGAFRNCDQLTKITIGKNVTYIGQSALYSEKGAISIIYCKAVTPPTLVNIIHNSQKVFFIYVPTESVSAYKSTSYWSRYKDYIFAYDFE